MRIFSQLAGRCRIAACVFAVVVFVAGIPALTQRAEQAQSIGGSLPALSGSKAIEHLKQNRQYDSLLEAFNATSYAQTDETLTDDAFVQTAKLTTLDGADGDCFGISIAVSGDTAIVGAECDYFGTNYLQGSAYIFFRSGTSWSQQQKLSASDGGAYDHFGTSVAIFGDTVIVGASDDDIGANSTQGSAYIFVRSGTVWSQQQKLTASDGLEFDEFGISVALSGDTAIVGAYRDGIGQPDLNQGSAYVFTRAGTMWSEVQKLIASDIDRGDMFGRSVAMSGDTAIIGADGALIAEDNGGAAYSFVRVGTMWVEEQKLAAVDLSGAYWFGRTVSISGDTAIIGAITDAFVNRYKGSAYVFVRSGTTWSQQQKLTAADGVEFDRFGFSVSISGDKAIIGAHGANIGANDDQGAAYIFTRGGTVWNQQQKLTASDGARFDKFGESVAIAGNTAIVGAISDDVGKIADQGSAYVFTRSTGFEGDLAPRNAGDGVVITTDVVQMRRFASGLDTADPASNEFQRADSSPRTTFGEGIINVSDVVQARRYATGLDPLTPAAGPAVAAGRPLTAVGTRSRIRTYLDCIAAANTRASVITQPRALFWPRQALPCVLR